MPISNISTTLPISKASTTIPISNAQITLPIFNTPTTILKSNAPTTISIYNASTTNSISTLITYTPEITQITEKIKTITTTPNEQKNIFLLGFVGFLRTKTSLIFYVYFIKVDGLSEIMYLYLKIIYLNFRRLNDKIEEKKVE